MQSAFEVVVLGKVGSCVLPGFRGRIMRFPFDSRAAPRVGGGKKTGTFQFWFWPDGGRAMVTEPKLHMAKEPLSIGLVPSRCVSAVRWNPYLLSEWQQLVMLRGRDGEKKTKTKNKKNMENDLSHGPGALLIKGPKPNHSMMG